MKVSWDDYSQYMENNPNVPNHQAEMDLTWFKQQMTGRLSTVGLKVISGLDDDDDD